MHLVQSEWYVYVRVSTIIILVYYAAPWVWLIAGTLMVEYYYYYAGFSLKRGRAGSAAL